MSAQRLDKGAWSNGPVCWVDGDTAMISIAFTWHVPQAREAAQHYRHLGLKVRIGGSGAFTTRKHLDDVADEVGGSIPDAIARHNPQATRASLGCPVACWFCIVSKKDGKEFTLLPDFVPRPVLCDDNLSALPADYQAHIVERYRASGVQLLDANSGFEPRTFTEETRERWAPILRGPWRFAFDEQSEGKEVERVFSETLRGAPQAGLHHDRPRAVRDLHGAHPGRDRERRRAIRAAVHEA